jgi:hypothetical protein
MVTGKRLTLVGWVCFFIVSTRTRSLAANSWKSFEVIPMERAGSDCCFDILPRHGLIEVGGPQITGIDRGYHDDAGQ